jgi:hypothetical protein
MECSVLERVEGRDEFEVQVRLDGGLKEQGFSQISRTDQLIDNI